MNASGERMFCERVLKRVWFNSLVAISFYVTYGKELVEVYWGPSMFYLVHEFQVVEDELFLEA